jgi:hypothetical protein
LIASLTAIVEEGGRITGSCFGGHPMRKMQIKDRKRDE